MKTQKYGLTIVVALMVAVLVTPAVALAGNNLVVTLRGVGTVMDAADNPIPDIDENGTLCFETELFDTKTDHLIGTGADCLQAIAAYDSNGDPADEFDLAPTVTLTRTTFFYFPQGTMAATGRTTVAPQFEVSPGPPPVTHIVGDITGPGGDNILTQYGTGRFKNAAGSVRLSGAVDMSALGTEGKIGFNCVFVITLD